MYTRDGDKREGCSEKKKRQSESRNQKCVKCDIMTREHFLGLKAPVRKARNVTVYLQGGLWFPVRV